MKSAIDRDLVQAHINLTVVGELAEGEQHYRRHPTDQFG
jgi:hypothetical protein